MRNKHPEIKNSQLLSKLSDDNEMFYSQKDIADNVSAGDCLLEMWKVIQDIWFAVRLSLDVLFDYVMVIACVLMFLRQTNLSGSSYNVAFDQTLARVLQAN